MRGTYLAKGLHYFPEKAPVTALVAPTAAVDSYPHVSKVNLSGSAHPVPARSQVGQSESKGNIPAVERQVQVYLPCG